MSRDKEFYERSAARKKRWAEEKRRREKRKKVIQILAILIVIGFVAGFAFGKIQKKHRTDPNPSGVSAGVSAGEENPGTVLSEGTSGNTVSENDVFSDTVEDEPLSKPITYEKNAETKNMDSDQIISEYGLLVNVDDGTVVAEKHAEERMNPASMTKILTILVAAEQLGDVTSKLDDTLEYTIEMGDFVYRNDCSAVGFSVGEHVPVKDLFYGTILKSGGDAAVGLATYVAGSHEAFVELMNEKIEELGLSDTAHFTNCVGLYDENHYCTLMDMAVMLNAAMDNEFCREVLSEHKYTTTATEQHPDGIFISNLFLRRIEDKDCGGDVIGAKTGYVNESGNCAASYFTSKDGKNYICVTGKSASSWKCIYDHVAVYNIYAVGNTGYVRGE